MTEIVLQKGDSVIATLRKPAMIDDLVAKYPKERLLVLQLDVTKPDDVAAVFAKAKEAYGRIDVVFNNAGRMSLGELESMGDKAARDMMEVNFWGAAHVSREAVKFFREVNGPKVGGLLMQVSSRAGIVGNPGGVYYSASKFALEGLTESLVKELNPEWNIKVTMVEPGPFRTKLASDNIVLEEQHPAYADPSAPGSVFRQYIVSSNVDGDADKAVVVIEKLSHVPNPPLRLPLHRRTIAGIKDKAQSLANDVEVYGSWSDDVYFTE